MNYVYFGLLLGKIYFIKVLNLIFFLVIDICLLYLIKNLILNMKLEVEKCIDCINWI